MPYIAHDQIHQYYDKMSPVETQLYLRNRLVALKRVHDFNEIHRDVKPSNFLYNRKQQKFLLVDFGLAQDISRRGRKEQEKLQLKARTPTVDSASVEFLNPVNAGKKALKTVEIPMRDRLERVNRKLHVATAVSWLKALIHSHTSQLMMLGSENLLANFGTCLGIIEYRVQHANSLSK
ncbi:hypothetical protein pipiens_000516, partial [Culex pipiens pipiens]